MEPDRDIVLALVERCVAAAERDDLAAVRAVLRAHPNVAQPVRVRLAYLASAGLLSERILHDLDVLPSFGAYEVHEQIGRGGMGSVWRAHQREPVAREVALKVIHTGTDDRELLARFATEQRALALMNHAHIARLYDAGVTPQGRPYFAMELVRGAPITGYADARRLTHRQRLELLLPVLDAVQHAHQRGILHRDLKPSNVLVVEQDGAPLPKVIDFGVAKALEASGVPATTSFTLDGRLVGTPAYMSPEQVSGAVSDVDVRSDVYALGLLLYELSTGELPFDRERIDRASLRELVSLLVEHDTPAPSVRVARLGKASEVASARGKSPLGLRRALRGDLDWISMRALEKDRDQRYQSVKELADDLRRHLAGAPVHAGPRSLRYRVGKFVRRYRAPVAAAAVTVLGLAIALVMSLVFWLRADAARVQAERGFDAAMRAVDEMLTEVGRSDLEHVPHMGAVRRTLLERAVAFYQELLAQRGPAASDRLEVIDTELALANVLFLLGDLATAEGRVDGILTELGERLREAPEDPELRFRHGVARKCLAGIHARTGRFDEARSGFEAAVGELRELRRSRSKDRDVAIAYANALNNAGGILGRSDPMAGARLLAEAVAEFERLVAERFDATLASKAVMSRVFVASRLWDAGQRSDALDALRRAESAGEALFEAFPERVDVRRALALCFENAGLCRLRGGELDAARPEFEQAISMFRGLVADFPATPAFRQGLARCLNNLAAVHGLSGDSKQAGDLLETSVRQREELVRRMPDTETFRLGLVNSLLNLAAADLERSAEAVPPRCQASVERALELTEAALERSPEDPPTVLRRARALGYAARLAVRHHECREARTYFERELQVIDRASEPVAALFAKDRFIARAGLDGIALRLAVEPAERARAATALRTTIADALRNHPGDTALQRAAADARVGAARTLVELGVRSGALSWLRDPSDFVVGDMSTAIVAAFRVAARAAHLAHHDPELAVAAKHQEVDAWASVLAGLLDEAHRLDVDTAELLASPDLAALREHPELASRAHRR